MGYDINLRTKLSAFKISIVAEINRISEKGPVENRFECLRQVVCQVSARLTDSLAGSLARSRHFSENDSTALFGEDCTGSSKRSLFENENSSSDCPAGVDDLGRKLISNFATALRAWLNGGEASALVKIAGNNLRSADLTPANDDLARKALDRFLFAADTLLSDGSNSAQFLEILNVQS